jgi:hypothetical protein
MRKDLGLEYTDRIRLAIIGGERVTAIVSKNDALIAREVLAVHVHGEPQRHTLARDVEIDGETVRLEMDRA